ncbi:hypothetical protein VP1G_03722 [Cytospora mali]|uniref:Uncharacterized protein n=1 Tax=Cytospora mali TaxID=578113 RepID=A0A194UXG9_CYTMA|nr:hypothetical protein VP1G_03722 [Valsa mali var. pyri (nom. inval.)]
MGIATIPPLTLSPAPIHPPSPEIRDMPGGSIMNDDTVNEPDLNSVKFAMPLDQELGSTAEEDAPGEEVSDEEWRERECQQQQAAEVSATLQQGYFSSEMFLDAKPVPETGHKPDLGLSEGGRMPIDESFKAKAAAQAGSTSWMPSDAEPFNTPGQATTACRGHSRELVKNNNPILKTLETPQATSQIFKGPNSPFSNLAQHTVPAEASQPSPDDYIPDHMIEPFIDILQSQGHHEVAHMFLRQMRSQRKILRTSGQRNTTNPRTSGLSVARSNFTSSVDAPNAPRRSGIGHHHDKSSSLQSIFDSPDGDPDSQVPAFHRLLTIDGAVIADDPGVYGITEIWNSKGVMVAKGSSSRTHNDNDQTPTLNRQVIDIHIDDDLVGAAKVDAPVEKFRWLMSSSPLASRSSDVLPEVSGLTGGLGSPGEVCGNTRGDDAVVGDDGGDVELVEGKDVGAGGSRSVNLPKQEENDDNDQG